MRTALPEDPTTATACGPSSSAGGLVRFPDSNVVKPDVAPSANLGKPRQTAPMMCESMALRLHDCLRDRRSYDSTSRAASRSAYRSAQALAQRPSRQRSTRQLAPVGVALRRLRALHEPPIAAISREEKALRSFESHPVLGRT